MSCGRRRKWSADGFGWNADDCDVVSRKGACLQLGARNLRSELLPTVLGTHLNRCKSGHDEVRARAGPADSSEPSLRLNSNCKPIPKLSATHSALTLGV